MLDFSIPGVQATPTGSLQAPAFLPLSCCCFLAACSVSAFLIPHPHLWWLCLLLCPELSDSYINATSKWVSLLSWKALELLAFVCFQTCFPGFPSIGVSLHLAVHLSLPSISNPPSDVTAPQHLPDLMF